jgi:iron complex outermembrane receptor protein
VTAGAKEETAFESFSNVTSYDAYDLTFSRDVSLGEALDQKVGTGIAKRSFGPGSSRPIIRGFDGDRVLVMEDGIRTGTLSSQSGDHGEIVNPAQLERLEIVKGPATLLYSGNAIGGTVNAISRHHELHRHPHDGFRGYVSGSAGTTNALAGGSAGFELGVGNWMLWGSGAGVRSGDYTAPEQGEIFNSRSRSANGGGGFGWFGRKAFVSFDVKVDEGRYGIPFANEFHAHGHEEEGEEHEEEHEEEEDEEHEHEGEIERVSIDVRRQSYRLNWGLQNLGSVIDSFEMKLSYVDWEHDEVEFFEDGDSGIGTFFQNDQFVYRGVFEQGRSGPLSGRFGFWGIDRDYSAEGEEALSPPIDQNGFAFFALEEIDVERVKFQFGGRIETQRYNPAFAERGHGHEHEEEEEEHEEEGEEHHEEEEVPDAVKRTFTGGSAAAGLHADLWRGGAFVANYAHSYRAPSLEELYNFGPHVGNLAFEIGHPNLDAERGNGVDLSLRHAEGRVQGGVNLFYYDFSNFVFPFATGEEEDGLRVIEYTQRDARFTGAEANLDLGLHRDLWLNLGADFVDAQDTELNTPLPRIPPLRGRIGFDYNRAGFRFAPELILASQQHQTFTGETRTPGYAVVNLKASYTIARQHLAHQFSVNVFNVGDRLYRNHSSFIKDLAPEIGRGVRFTYMVRFF